MLLKVTATERRSAPAVYLGAALLLLALDAPLALGAEPAGNKAPAAATAAATSPTHTLVESPRPEAPQQLLVGIVVAGREVDTIEVSFDGSEFLIPLESFLTFCECDLIVTRSGEEIATPIGSVALQPGDTVQEGGIRSLRESTLTDKLAIRVLYDASRYALLLDLPWHGRKTGPGRGGPGAELTPDVRAPSTNISSAVVRLRHSRQTGRNVSSANVRLFGRAAGGLWGIRYDDNLTGRRTVSEYGWMRRIGSDKLLLLGNQRIALHPLLSVVEMTGVQTAWTNQPLEMFQASLRPTELLPRQLRSRRTVSGVGIPAGTAVLRVNDQTLAAQTIGLDGLYEFRDVPVLSSQANRIEVLIFDRHNLTTPVDIQDHSMTASEYMLPAGAFVAQGGLGQAGNPLDEETGQAAGFVQGRYGVSSALTIEAVAQTARGRPEVAVGGILQADASTVISFAGARANGHNGYQLDADYERDAWRAQLRSIGREPGFFSLGTEGQFDHFMEVSRRSADRSFEVGVVARYRTGARPARFVLPAFSWRPSSALFARARPDFDGYYRFDLSWQPGRDWRVGLSRVRELTLMDVSRSISRSLRLELLGEIRDEGGSRIGGVVSWFGSGRFSPSISGGPLFTDGRPGAIVQLQAQVLPGVLLGARYETHSVLDRPDAARDHRIALSLTSNVSFSGGILPGSLMDSAPTLGGIAGRLIVVGDYEVRPEALQGLTVRVDGLTSVVTFSDGFFRFSNLPEGIYRIQLDPEKLPIELTPRDLNLLVEVVPGAVTRADFLLDVAFGLAGRVRVDGRPIANAWVELVDGQNQVLAAVRTDAFGLYRIDEVPIGAYTIRLAARNVPGIELDWPARPVRIVDDFLFDQDLDLVLEGSPGSSAIRRALGIGPGSRAGQ